MLAASKAIDHRGGLSTGGATQGYHYQQRIGSLMEVHSRLVQAAKQGEARCRENSDNKADAQHVSNDDRTDSLIRKHSAKSAL